jgi:CBS domain-containing protein
MIRVREVMSRPAESIAGHEMLSQAARQILDKDLRLLVVVSDEGHAIGTLSERDIVTVVAQGQDPTRRRVSEAANSDVQAIDPGDDIETAARRMGELGLRRLPVCHDGELVGIVALEDLVPGHLGAGGILEALHRRRSSNGATPRRHHLLHFGRAHAA